MRPTRYDFASKGKQFIFVVAFLYIFTGAAYWALHVVIPPSDTTFAALDCVAVNQFGEVSIQSAEDIDWYIGTEKGKPLLEAMSHIHRTLLVRDCYPLGGDGAMPISAGCCGQITRYPGRPRHSPPHPLSSPR